MRLFNIVWVPSGKSWCFAALQENEIVCAMHYTDWVVRDLLSDADELGAEYAVWNLTADWLCETHYELSYLQELAKVFPIEIEEYVIKDTLSDVLGKYIRDYKVGDDSKYWEYPPNAAPYVMRPTSFPPLNVPWCSTTTIKTSS